VVVDWLVEAPVAVEFCAGVDADGVVVVVVEPGWLWVVVEVDGAVDGDCANAAVASARLMADVAKRRIFILLAPVVGAVARINGGRRLQFRKPGKTGNGGPGNLDPRRSAPGRALTVFPAKTGAPELLPFFAVHSATPQGTNKKMVTHASLALFRILRQRSSRLVAARRLVPAEIVGRSFFAR
jgi:hypothetical protein